MIRAIRPTATADTPVEWLTGWNVAPNDNYQVDVTPAAATVGVILSRGGVIVATGGCLPGTDQPVMLAPAPGQTLDRIDADIPWHMLISSPAIPASVTLAAMVDLPDEIHPVYQSDTLALTRATGLIDNGTHITADITATCPLGLGAGLGAVVAVPVDGQTVAGQVESITWTATPDGAIEQAVIRQHIPIAPAAPTPPPAPPVVADDTGATDAATTTSGNVLTNDGTGLTVVAVNGLSARVGQAVTGSNGGEFVIGSTGAWTFDPSGDFAGLTGSDTATTSVTYHASDGVSEAMGTLTVTVSSSAAQPWTPAGITTAMWLDAADSLTATVVDGKISQRSDKSGNSRHATQSTAGLRPVAGTNRDIYDGVDDRMTVPDSAVLDSPKYMMVICKPTPSKDWAAVLEKWHSSAGWQIVYGGGATRTLPSLSVNSSSINAPAHVNNTIAVFEGQIDGSNSFFGTTASGFATGTLPAPTATTSVLWVGGEAGSSNVLAMDFHEAIVLASVPDTATRQRLQGYASHKWDALLGVTTLVSALPSDHPYKSAPPTI